MQELSTEDSGKLGHLTELSTEEKRESGKLKKPFEVSTEAGCHTTVLIPVSTVPNRSIQLDVAPWRLGHQDIDYLSL